MKTKTTLLTLTIATALTFSPALFADNASGPSTSGSDATVTTPPASKSDAAESKSGAGPGSNGSVPPASTASTTGTSAAPSQAPSTGDAGQSKSGLAPGANANPVGSAH